MFTVLVGLVLSGCQGGSSGAHDGARPGAASRASGSHTVHRYVALGDSYTAAPMVPVTDVADGCFRSSGNYPSRVAQSLGAHLDDRSCSGAATAQLWRRQAPGVPPQLSAVDARTDLVTLGIGGNDAGVFRRMLACADPAAHGEATTPCRLRMTRPDGRDRVLDAVRSARSSLLRAVREIHRRAPHARVLLVGYPRLLTAGRTCARLPLAPGDYAYAERVNQALDQNLAYAARHAGATYVDVWSASRGHDICADRPWINGARTDQRRAAAFHPFAGEQQAVARLVLAALREDGAR